MEEENAGVKLYINKVEVSELLTEPDTTLKVESDTGSSGRFIL